MRRKNRQIKMMVDIPASFNSEEEFMEALMGRLDNVDWVMKVVDIEDEEAEDIKVPISRVSFNEIEIEPEEED